ncbi:hypothetical protein [Anaerophilus nitritogenes]|uniref:hypothetical protein n=1 Tax=Anaerophilus nitritogenes TaxID=2498136 RepID=UPI00101D447A|nr:hypothetical protein [Anaerophilus nitritogenes]
MTKIKKNMIDLDTVLVEMKFVLKGNRQLIRVHTTAIKATEFVDWLNENRYKNMSRAEKKQFDNQFFIFEDYKKKETVMIERDSIKSMTIPFYMQKNDDDEIDWKVLCL